MSIVCVFSDFSKSVVGVFNFCVYLLRLDFTATIDSCLQSAPVVKIRTFFLTKGRKGVHTCPIDHVYDADFFKFRRHLFADGGLENKSKNNRALRIRHKHFIFK